MTPQEFYENKAATIGLLATSYKKEEKWIAYEAVAFGLLHKAGLQMVEFKLAAGGWSLEYMHDNVLYRIKSKKGEMKLERTEVASYDIRRASVTSSLFSSLIGA